MHNWPPAITALPPLREVIKVHNLAAKKNLGQNFLLDLNITDKIARAVDGLDALNVIEVGPGPGGLTRALAARAKSVVAVERDARCVAALAELVAASADKLQVIEADAQQVDYEKLAPSPRGIVANLPYNIGTDLLIGWLQQGRLFRSLTLMFQQEVAERIVATPGGKAYGRLAILVAATATARIVLKLPPGAFTPPPKVSSAVVQVHPFEKPLCPLDALEKVTATAFQQRRKMVKSSLQPLFSEAQLTDLGIDITVRPESLPPQIFFKLAHLLAERG